MFQLIEWQKSFFPFAIIAYERERESSSKNGRITPIGRAARCIGTVAREHILGWVQITQITLHSEWE